MWSDKAEEEASRANVLRIIDEVRQRGIFKTRTPEGKGEWRVEGVLAEKVARWKEEQRREKEEEERRLRGMRWDDDSMEVDDEENVEGEEDVDVESEDGVQDSDEVRALKVSSSSRSQCP